MSHLPQADGVVGDGRTGGLVRQQVLDPNSLVSPSVVIPSTDERVATYAMQEMVRRAERGVGLAIRKGQAEGTVATTGQRRTGAGGLENTICFPSDLASKVELVGNESGIYHLTDDVTDEQFDAAIDADVRRPSPPGDKVKPRPGRSARAGASSSNLEELLHRSAGGVSLRGGIGGPRRRREGFAPSRAGESAESPQKARKQPPETNSTNAQTP